MLLPSETKAKELPVLTISSGPTNSMRGAAFLSGVEDAVVIDIGGTTTDVGVIKSGFPREASGYAKVQDFNLCNYDLPRVDNGLSPLSTLGCTCSICITVGLEIVRGKFSRLSWRFYYPQSEHS